MLLELMTFLVVVIIIVAILDRWSLNKPTLPPADEKKPQLDEIVESRFLKDDDSSSIPLEGDAPPPDTDSPQNSDPT